MEDFKAIEKKYLREKEIHETKQVISSFICPICGNRLRGHIRSCGGDTLDIQGMIECDHCEMFSARSEWHSEYEKGNPENDCLIEVMNKVRPYIKNFGTPLENV